MTKKYLAIIFIVLGTITILGFRWDVNAQKDSELFTIYLVRHAEKDLTGSTAGDPPLTECGGQRAELLSRLLSDVPLEAVYSTNYTRTQNTALPTATSKGLKIKQYDPQNLADFAAVLVKKQQDALVVGHSNTTGVLAGLLVGEEIGEFDLDIYNRVYQVVIHKNTGRLHILHTAFDCSD